MKAIEAEIDENGQLRLLEELPSDAGRRALVIVLDEGETSETALLSEAALAEDWNRPEEEAAWSNWKSAQ